MKEIWKYIDGSSDPVDDNVYLALGHGDSGHLIDMVPIGVDGIRMNHPGHVLPSGKYYVYTGKSRDVASKKSSSEFFVHGANFQTEWKLISVGGDSGSNTVNICTEASDYPVRSRVVPFVFIHCTDKLADVQLKTVTLTDGEPVITFHCSSSLSTVWIFCKYLG